MGRSGDLWMAWIGGLFVASVSAPLRAEGTATTSIWYRSQEGCPDADAFLARVQARGLHAQIAQVGDAIDFVVTVSGGAANGRGLLERQTKSGTVAVRLLEGGSCDEIVDGMALSLTLADSPENHHPEPRPLPAPPPTRDVAKASETKAVSSSAPPRPSPWTLGAQGTSVFGAGPAAMFGGAVFIGFTPTEARPGPSFRLAAIGNFGSGSEGAHAYELGIFGARLEGAVELGWTSIHVNPFAALDVGALRAEGQSPDGRSETASWIALRPGLRVEVPVTRLVGLEAQLEGVIPFTRYRLRSAQPPQSVLYETAALGVAVGAGASVRLP